MHYPDEINIEPSQTAYGDFYINQIWEIGERHSYQDWNAMSWEHVNDADRFKDVDVPEMEQDTALRLAAAYNATLGIPYDALLYGRVVQRLVNLALCARKTLNIDIGNELEEICALLVKENE